MHAIHNAALIQQILPRTLTAPHPYLVNRTQKHQEIACDLHVTQTTKRAETEAKTAATRAKKQMRKTSSSNRAHKDETHNPLHPLQSTCTTAEGHTEASRSQASAAPGASTGSFRAMQLTDNGVTDGQMMSTE